MAKTDFFERINRAELEEIRIIKRFSRLKSNYEEELEEEEKDIISFLSKYGIDNNPLLYLVT